MRWQLGGRLISAGFVAAALILAFVGWESDRNTVRFAEAAVWRQHTYEALGTLDDTVARVVDAETGQRGYLLTGDEAYLEPYHVAAKNFDQIIGKLTNLTSDNPNQQKRIQILKPLVAQKLSELQRTIDLRKNEGLAAANLVVREGSGKRWMDQIRAEVGEMTSEEDGHLTLRTQRTNESVAAAREVIVEVLTSEGYAVMTAADGAQARVLVATSLPELVILDLMLPKVSGFELIADWRSNPRTADLPVFVLTSKDLSKEEEGYIRQHSEYLYRKQDSWRESLARQLRRVVPHGQVESV